MDPLSDMLSLLRVRSYMSGGFDAGGDWSLHFDQHVGIKFYAVVDKVASRVLGYVENGVHPEI